jgi:hypothetical protein
MKDNKRSGYFQPHCVEGFCFQLSVSTICSGTIGMAELTRALMSMTEAPTSQPTGQPTIEAQDSTQDAGILYGVVLIIFSILAL